MKAAMNFSRYRERCFKEFTRCFSQTPFLVQIWIRRPTFPPFSNAAGLLAEVASKPEIRMAVNCLVEMQPLQWLPATRKEMRPLQWLPATRKALGFKGHSFHGSFTDTRAGSAPRVNLALEAGRIWPRPLRHWRRARTWRTPIQGARAG